MSHIRSALLSAACLLSLSLSLRAADVREHGATGDGQTDDTAAVQRAVDLGGEIRFSRGTYRLTRTVRVHLPSTGLIALVGEGAAVIEMHGAGPAFHLEGSLPRTANPGDFKEEFWARERMPVVRGLALVGWHAESVGVRVAGTMQFTITGCHFRQLRHGIHVTGRNRNIIIADTHVYNSRGSGVFLDGCDLHQINIGDCHISYNKGGGIVARGGAVRNLQIGTCDIEANVDSRGPPAANIMLDSTGGSIGEVEITGCTVQHYSGIPGFANIRFVGHSKAVPYTSEQRHGNLVITGNLLNDADVNLHLDGARAAVVSGNSIHQSTTLDVLVENSSQVVLSNSILDRHPRYKANRPDSRLRQGIVFRNSDNCTLTGLRINGGESPAAIALHGGTRFIVSNCSIAEVAGVGLLLENVGSSLVTANLLDASTTGPVAIRVAGGAGNVIDLNVINGQSEIDERSIIPARVAR